MPLNLARCPVNQAAAVGTYSMRANMRLASRNVEVASIRSPTSTLLSRVRSEGGTMAIGRSRRTDLHDHRGRPEAGQGLSKQVLRNLSSGHRRDLQRVMQNLPQALPVRCCTLRQVRVRGSPSRAEHRTPQPSRRPSPCSARFGIVRCGGRFAQLDPATQVLARATRARFHRARELRVVN